MRVGLSRVPTKFDASVGCLEISGVLNISERLLRTQMHCSREHTTYSSDGSQDNLATAQEQNEQEE